MDCRLGDAASMGFRAKIRRAPADRPRTHFFPQTIARMVSPVSAGLALAALERSVPHLDLGDYAAADARGCRYSLLRTIPGAIPRCARACGSAARRSAAAVVWTRLLQPGA